VTLLDDVLPRWHVRERHTIEVDAAPERVFAAVREATFGEMPLARALFRLRGMGAATARPLFEQLPAGFAVLAEEIGRELVVGGLGQPWKPLGGRSPRADFASFDEPGFAKMAMSLRLDGSTLSTETRVLVTDSASRRKFLVYWVAIRAGSGLIRRSWLKAIKRRAEAG
jgi:hypothetical protein